MKKILILMVGCLFALGLFGCSQGQKTNYIDDQAMSIIANGFEKRSDYVTNSSMDSAKEYKGAVQAEIDADAELKTAQFEDSKMQEVVISYLNSLDDQLKVIEGNQYGSADFYKEWSKAYDKRTSIVKTLVDDYGLTVGDKYKEAFDQLVANGSSVVEKNTQKEAIQTLFMNAEWEKTSSGGSYYQYTTVIENTTNYNFKGVSATVSLYDVDGVKTESSVYANTWSKGEKAKFSLTSQTDAERVVATISYYNVA